MAQESFATVREEDWGGRRIQDSIMVRIIINPNDDDSTESSAISDEEDPRGVVPLSTDSK
jgi:hypothetical protein